MSERDTQAVETAALLHDIGKLAVPEHILSKPGPLSADERKKMQIHAQVGAEIVAAVAFPCPSRRSSGAITSAGTEPDTLTVCAAKTSRLARASSP